jgi:hypothetical protein
VVVLFVLRGVGPPADGVVRRRGRCDRGQAASYSFGVSVSADFCQALVDTGALEERHGLVQFGPLLWRLWRLGGVRSLSQRLTGVDLVQHPISSESCDESLPLLLLCGVFRVR